jgi:aminopeptidase 2
MLSLSDRVLYTSKRLAQIATEAAKTDSCFDFNDRIGLVNDAMALAKAGFSNTSSAMTLIDIFRNEQECWFPFLLLDIMVHLLTLLQSWFGIVSQQIWRPSFPFGGRTPKQSNC